MSTRSLKLLGFLKATKGTVVTCPVQPIKDILGNKYHLYAFGEMACSESEPQGDSLSEMLEKAESFRPAELMATFRRKDLVAAMEEAISSNSPISSLNSLPLPSSSPSPSRSSSPRVSSSPKDISDGTSDL